MHDQSSASVSLAGKNIPCVANDIDQSFIFYMTGHVLLLLANIKLQPVL